jgi:hypothetical protein
MDTDELAHDAADDMGTAIMNEASILRHCEARSAAAIQNPE